ncbi:MAG: biotin transporter BioY [Microbacteriaceae bacterium]|nr:biotin transporter BioY [Microbacteriaceae bacterium]
MTALSPAAPRRLVLADRVIPRHLVTDITLVVLGAAFVGGLAQIYVPLWPVPVTGQTLAVLLVGSTLGALRGAASMVVYALAGGIGVPWFSEAAHGWGIIAGPTGGYIVGFILSAAFVGWLAEAQWDRKILKAAAAFLGGSLVVFAVGLPWLAFVLGLEVATTLEFGFYPFIVGGIVKAAIAAGLLPLAWWAAGKLSRSRSE